MNLLNEIVKLSHEFGSPEYLKGGGGNTSAKDDDTLWIKPSGTTLTDLRPESFVAMSRAKLAELYEVTPPAKTCAREALVKNLMMAAVWPDSSGRPLGGGASPQFVQRHICCSYPSTALP